MNYLALDWGQKNVGLARANSQARLAQPLPSLAHDETFLDKLRATIAHESTDKLILGFPRNLAGEKSTQSQEVEEFATKLEQDLKLPVTLQDETLTTQQALDRPAKNFDRHSLAAVTILQDYLNENPGT